MEQALMYQRMFEGLTFYEKLSKITKIPEAGQNSLHCSILEHWGGNETSRLVLKFSLPHRRRRKEILWWVHHSEPCGSAVVSNYDPALECARIVSGGMCLFSVGTWAPIPSRQLVNYCFPGEGGGVLLSKSNRARLFCRTWLIKPQSSRQR